MGTGGPRRNVTDRGVIQEGIVQLRESLSPPRVSRFAAAAVGLVAPVGRLLFHLFTHASL